MTKTRGRPKLANEERLTHVSLRLPQWLIAWYDKQGNRSKVMRIALENYAAERVDTV